VLDDPKRDDMDDAHDFYVTGQCLIEGERDGSRVPTEGQQPDRVKAATS
jgi:hypothetical protein